MSANVFVCALCAYISYTCGCGHSPVYEGCQRMVVSEGDKVQFGESPRGEHSCHGLAVLVVPARRVDVLVVSQVVQVLYQTTTETNLTDRQTD